MRILPIDLRIRGFGLPKIPTAAVAALGLAVLAGVAAIADLSAYADRRAALSARTDALALAALAAGGDPEAAVRTALGADADYFRVAARRGRLDPGEGPAAARFRSDDGGDAVLVAVTGRTRLPVSGLAGLRLELSASTVAAPEPRAVVGLGGTAGEPADGLGAALVAALVGRDPTSDPALFRRLAGLSVDLAAVVRALSESEDDGAVPIAAVFKAAAAVRSPADTAARSTLLALSAAAEATEGRIDPRALLRIDSRAVAGTAAALPVVVDGTDFLARLLRAASTTRAVRIVVDKPAPGIARVEAALLPPPAPDREPALFGGPAGSATAIPPLRLAVRATLSGSTVPSAPAIQLPFLVLLGGGGAAIRTVDCHAQEPDRDRVDVDARPVQASLVFAPFPTDSETPDLDGRPVEFIQTTAFTALVRGATGRSEDRVSELSFWPRREPGASEAVRTPLGLDTGLAKLFSEAEILVVDEAGNAEDAGPIREEIRSLMTADAPRLADLVVSAFAVLGIEPGALSIRVPAMACDGAVLVP